MLAPTVHWNSKILRRIKDWNVIERVRGNERRVAGAMVEPGRKFEVSHVTQQGR